MYPSIFGHKTEQEFMTITILGAGRSSASLIRYLGEKGQHKGWKLRVGDMDEATAARRVVGLGNAESFAFNVNDQMALEREVKGADLVISMLPAVMHISVIKECIKYKKNIITPSYVTPEIKALDAAAREAGIVVLNEMGVDPGIDHMSAMEILDKIKSRGGRVTRFESFTGGLIAPESDDNPWHYKFTWNPRNVVMAGAGGTAMFIQEGQLKYIPYHRLFQRIREIDIEGSGRFEGYANRDSLKYREVYGLDDIPTLYRGTLRKAGFCKAWDVFVQLGMTDESYTINYDGTMTYRDFVNSYLSYDPEKSVEQKLRDYLDLDDQTMARLEWIGLFEKETIGLTNATPAAILQKKLEGKWVFNDSDKDMIVMWHLFRYELSNETREIQASMVYVGRDNVLSAMSDTVGLPVALAAEMILSGELNVTGVLLPITPNIYAPILERLKEHGIYLGEKEYRV
jgi:saccharopine dehydrogenase-like NADP-dependent oxidoreductase